MSERKMDRRTPSGPNAPAAKPEVPADRPDVHTRYPPGRSGNPKGRPKGAKGRKQIVREIARETHEVVEGGRRRRRMTLHLVLLSLRHRAVDGDVKAFRAVHELLQRYAPEQTVEPTGLLIVPEPIPRDEWEKLAYEQQRKGRGEPDPEGDASST